MAKRMLVDATHPEETRVVVVNNNRLEELDFEIASRKQLKGNIYLARVVRVEPSLQAAFVEYGGNRHGFLAFSEIHPDYYRIPVADREAYIRQQRDLAAAAERAYAGRDLGEDASGDAETAYAETGDAELGDEPLDIGADRNTLVQDVASDGIEDIGADPAPADTVEGSLPPLVSAATGDGPGPTAGTDEGDDAGYGAGAMAGPEGFSPLSSPEDGAGSDGEDGPEASGGEAGPGAKRPRRGGPRGRRRPRTVAANVEGIDRIEEEVEEPRRTPRARPLKSYKIQEVIKRRQILLVQVVKEERGNKGAALTTYLSLPGRYCVLMPNTDSGGGISRKITNPADRKRLKELMEDLDIPEGMSVILRTAGIERSKPEIKRDLEYLMRLWDSIRELTLQSIAPALIYEEANLIKRSIRDLYTSDLDEVMVEGDAGYRTAKDFMRMLMPSHAKKVQPYKDDVPLFHRFQVEGAIEMMFNPVVQLRSGGYIVINQTEALVAIDVNSGRSTKERNIEETALKTNIEAADEIARQLRLRDLAGLIVIDFIDMEESRNNVAVEKRLKDAMRLDRARIQLGRISAFGLLELSRQRLRPSLQEINFERCPHCIGTGMIRSTESAALAVLRAIEEEGIRRRSAEITVTAATSVTLYILNQKREMLTAIERRYGLRVFLAADDSLIPPELRLERLRAKLPGEDQPSAAINAERVFAESGKEIEEAGEDDPEIEAEEAEPAPAQAKEVQPRETGEREGTDRDGRRRRRRRRRRGGEGRNGEGGTEAGFAADAADEADDDRLPDDALEGTPDIGFAPEDTGDGAEVDLDAVAAEPVQAGEEDGPDGDTPEGDGGGRKKRRRGKRGGRRRARQRLEGDAAAGETTGDGSAETTFDGDFDDEADDADLEPAAIDIGGADIGGAEIGDTGPVMADAGTLAGVAGDAALSVDAEGGEPSVVAVMPGQPDGEPVGDAASADPTPVVTADAADMAVVAPVVAVAVDGDEASTKAPRKRTSRKKTASDDTVTTVATVDAAAVAEPAQPKRATRSRKAKTGDTVDSAAPLPAEPSAPAEVIAPAEATAKKPRARRTKAAAEAEPTVELTKEPGIEGDGSLTVDVVSDAQTAATPGDGGQGPAETSGGDAQQPLSAAAAESDRPSGQAPEGVAKPSEETPKRGWWNRLIRS